MPGDDEYLEQLKVYMTKNLLIIALHKIYTSKVFSDFNTSWKGFNQFKLLNTRV